MYPVCTLSLANKPLERAGMDPCAEVVRASAARSAPIR
jgi:hypothetical protein